MFGMVPDNAIPSHSRTTIRMNMKNLCVLHMLIVLPLLLSQIGCESSADASGNIWATNPDSSTSTTVTPTTPTPTPTPAPEGSVPGNIASDAVPFGALNFCYGGANGSGAEYVPAEIHGLRMSRGSLSYSWGSKNLSSWGLSKGDAGALCCLFVQKADGSWVGGKFDWISTSRTSRPLDNVFKHYCGWSLQGVPNPCQAAFVIISKNGKKRSNVISTTWRR